MFLVVLGAYLIIAAVQMPKLIKNKHWKDLTFFCIFLGAAMILSLLYTVGVKITSPALIIKSVFNAIGLHY